MSGLTEGALLAGRYEILKTVGRGGMGIVYKAHDRELDELVAVKLLRSETLRSKDALRRLKGEVRLARRIRHRNVSAIHELGQEGHLRFVIMEFVDGVDLKHVLRDRVRLPAHEALPLLIQAAAGLEAIHEAGIVHRDLKTPNIMLDRRGLVRLMDFGIAKLFDVESEAGGTATGSVVGTPEYMSPEQVRGEKLDARSDIYALGIVVYELLTGTVPFKGDTPLATLFKQVQEPPPLEGERASHLPAPLIPVLRKMLEKDRGDRMGTAGDVIVALEAVRAETSQQAFGPKAHYPILLSAEAPEDQPELSTLPIATAVPTRRRPAVTEIQHDLAPSVVKEREIAPPTSDTASVVRPTPISSPRIDGGSQNEEAAASPKRWGAGATFATTIPHTVPAPLAAILRTPSQVPIARGPEARTQRRLLPWLGGGILVAMAAAGVVGWRQSRANEPISPSSGDITITILNINPPSGSTISLAAQTIGYSFDAPPGGVPLSIGVRVQSRVATGGWIVGYLASNGFKCLVADATPRGPYDYVGPITAGSFQDYQLKFRIMDKSPSCTPPFTANASQFAFEAFPSRTFFEFPVNVTYSVVR